jgi:hypothetical protein
LISLGQTSTDIERCQNETEDPPLVLSDKLEAVKGKMYRLPSNYFSKKDLRFMFHDFYAMLFLSG